MVGMEFYFLIEGVVLCSHLMVPGFQLVNMMGVRGRGDEKFLWA